MKALYRPLSLLCSVGGGLLASTMLKKFWRRVTGGSKAPKAVEPAADPEMAEIEEILRNRGIK